MRLILSFALFSILSVKCDFLEEVFRWKQISYTKSASSDIVFDNDDDKLEDNSFGNEKFVQYHNLPMGVSHHKGRLFITVPRRRTGIVATLNYVTMKNDGEKYNKSPPLKGYPNFIVNTLRENYSPDPKRIISVYRTMVDKCERLWFVDTGLLEFPNNFMQVQRPAIWIIDLKNDRKIRRFEIPESIVTSGVGLASIAVDADPDHCEDAHAYLPDWNAYKLHVYSFKENKMWQFSHNYFRNEPVGGDFNIAGNQFKWDDGIFSIAVGNKIPGTNVKNIYFHALAATSEYMTTSAVLKNESLAASNNYSFEFKFLADRGPNTQTTTHFFDESTGLMFLSEVNRNSIGCWNSANQFLAKNLGIVHLDYKNMIYPADLTVDTEGTMWILSNSLPIWIYSHLNEDEYNFRIWRQNVRKAVNGTICQLK